MAKKDGFNSPFAGVARDLKKKMEAEAEAAAQAKAAKKPAPAPAKKAPQDEPELSFAELMGEGTVKRRDPRGHTDAAKPAETARAEARDRDDADALASLAALVDNDDKTLEVGDDEDVVEGWVHGLDRKVLRSLKRGDYKVDATLDLHGLRQEQARDAVERFVGDARGRGARALLIIHGRGHGSEHGVPVLKQGLSGWLARGRSARHVLAFCPAAPHDGGAGAVYVLLRR